MRLFLVRHPQPLIAPGICYGSTDLAIAPGQLALAVAALSSTLPANVPLFCSPLRRCAELAAQLTAPLASTSFTVDARLAELDFGRWEMRAWDAIARADIDAWALEPVHYRPGGGESVLHMAARIQAWHAHVQALGHERAIVICHAGTMRLLAACQSDLPAMARQAASKGHHIAHGATLIVDC
jgi:alpha-ribazole phosphatase